MKIPNNCVLITGAAGGIGYVIVKSLSEQGFKILATDYADKLKKIKTWPKNVELFAADLTDSKEVDKLSKEALKFKINGIVHCAGYGGPFVDIVESSLEEWNKVFAINVNSLFIILNKTLSSFVKAKYGRVIAISSIQSLMGSPGSGAYVSSKHALNGLIKTVAAEFAPKGIRANLICPGYIKSPMGANDKKIDNYTQKVLERTPNRKLGEASEIARLCSFLLEASNDYINGSVITIDGGISADVGVL
ncbi:MAG: SDR family oxidoreductase [Proteobacteria bacterium]|nr:SDR family oxidoreductase [Pseudomonadota bacterium]